MSTSSDQELKDYILERIPANNRLFVNELDRQALVGYALEIQALFNKRVAAKTQTTDDIKDVKELNSKFVVKLNDYYGNNIERAAIGSGEVDIITGKFCNLDKREKDADGDSGDNKDDNNNNNNNNNNSKEKPSVNGKKNTAAAGILDANAIALVTAIASALKGAPAEDTLDENGRKKKRRKLGKRTENSVC